MKGFRKIDPQWRIATIRKILKNPIYIGEVWCNKETKVGTKYVARPKNERILIPDIAPAMISRASFELIQKYLQWNKEDALRSNKNLYNLGILRASFCRCGI